MFGCYWFPETSRALDIIGWTGQLLNSLPVTFLILTHSSDFSCKLVQYRSAQSSQLPANLIQILGSTSIRARRVAGAGRTAAIAREHSVAASYDCSQQTSCSLWPCDCSHRRPRPASPLYRSNPCFFSANRMWMCALLFQFWIKYSLVYRLN